MRAALVESIPTVDLRLVDDAPSPLQRPGEALIAVEACGICGTDLHILSGHSYAPETPFVLGHEPVGRIISDGDGAALRVGQRVTMTIFEGCGLCSFCRVGDERLCPRLRSIVGVSSRWGGFSERLTVPRGQLLEIPAGLSAVAAATLIDAGATAANAARVVSHLPAERPVVLGGGPVGLLTAEILRHDGIPASVVEPNLHRLEDLQRRGFDVAPSIGELSDQSQIDCVIDCAGVAGLVSDSLRLLRPRGALVVVGYTESVVDFSQVARKELHLVGIRSGSRTDLSRVLSLVVEGHVEPPVATEFPLSEINTALQAIRAGELAGKAVIIP